MLTIDAMIYRHMLQCDRATNGAEIERVEHDGDLVVWSFNVTAPRMARKLRSRWQLRLVGRGFNVTAPRMARK